MKNPAIVSLAFVLFVLPALCSAATPNEVTENPALLIAPNVKAADLMVYGIKLGDSPEKIPNSAATFERIPESNPEITFYTGKDVAYLAYKGKIIQIVVAGDFMPKLPPVDATRLQILLGKADLIDSQPEQVVFLSYLARQLRFSVVELHTLHSRITSVTLYAQ